MSSACALMAEHISTNCNSDTVGPALVQYNSTNSWLFYYYQSTVGLDRIICLLCVYICQYYTLRFYFPYLSLLAQPVNILVYGQGPINIMFSS
jgi:hypothetical protein